MTMDQNREPNDDHRFLHLADYLVYGLVLAVSLVPRLIAFEHVLDQPLEGDAANFYGIASHAGGPWSASLREPFFIFLHRLALWVLGGQAWAIRVQSLVFSLALIGLVTAIALRLFRSRAAAAVPGLILGLTPYMSFQASRGLRLELYLFLCLSLGAALTLRLERGDWKRIVGAGFLAAAVVLTRQTGMIVVVAAFGLALLKWSRKMGPGAAAKRLGLAGAIAVVLCAPFFINQARAYGHPFIISQRDATFWRNQEFRDRPGFPSSGELKVNPYAGPQVSPYQYLVRMHSLRGLVAGTMSGYLRSFTFYFKHALGGLWWLLFLAGPGVYALCRRGDWEWPLLFLAVLFPFAYIIPLTVSGHASVDARFAMHGYPLAALFMAAGVDWLLQSWKELKTRGQVEAGGSAG